MNTHGRGPAMNTANLQLQGLLIAVASINNALVHKGLLGIDEIDLALRKAEASLTGEERLFEVMSPATRVARMVGQTKEHYNDQM